MSPCNGVKKRSFDKVGTCWKPISTRGNVLVIEKEDLSNRLYGRKDRGNWGAVITWPNKNFSRWHLRYQLLLSTLPCTVVLASTGVKKRSFVRVGTCWKPSCTRGGVKKKEDLKNRSGRTLK